ncbi:MAG: oligosaccharide flippase family protein [Flavobacteriaceae bacterium]
MGIVLKQSFKNIIIVYAAFAIGGINTIFLYTRFLDGDYYGLVTFLLSAANLLMPLTAFGVQYTIVKFFSSYETKLERDKFLSLAMFLPLLIAIPFGFLGTVFYEQISTFLSLKNPIIKDYTYIIYLVAIATAYFEVFYAWSKVQLRSVFGNFIKEMYNRLAVMTLLFCVYFEFISEIEFIYYLTGAYFLRLLIMMLYAFKLYLPKFGLSLPSNYKEIFRYSAYIILAGSAGAILLDIDKVMIPGKEEIALAAYYAVALYIGTAIEAPGRAMLQILQPLTSKAINENNFKEVGKLYQQSSINLFLVGGLLFLLVNLNINEIFKLLPPEYSGGAWVVLLISGAKLYKMFLGINGEIILNSKYYRILLPLGLGMALSATLLNDWLIDLYSTNGAAISTLIVVLFFNSIKLWYVKKKFSLVPYSQKTLLLLVLIVLFFCAFHFIEFSFHPIINIGLKSFLIVIGYIIIVKQLNISEDINKVLKKYLKF